MNKVQAIHRHCEAGSDAVAVLHTYDRGMNGNELVRDSCTMNHRISLTMVAAVLVGAAWRFRRLWFINQLPERARRAGAI